VETVSVLNRVSPDSAVAVAAGLDPPKRMNVPGEAAVLSAFDYLWEPKRFSHFKKVVIVGGGAVAVDCAITARTQVRFKCLSDPLMFPSLLLKVL